MGPNERRMEIIEALCRRRQDTMANLAAEFGVSVRTIKNDIDILSLSYPIETIRGRYGGGVRVADGYCCMLKRCAVIPLCSCRFQMLRMT